MEAFIQTYWSSIIIVIVAIIALLVAYKFGNKTIVKQIVLNLVVQAEKALGSGTGTLKYAMVIDAIYNRLPFILRMLFSKTEIDSLIEEGVTELKKVLSDNNTTLTGYDDEKYIDSLTKSK